MSTLAEPHHVPHGYVHPKEHHHWWWYAGFVVAFVAMALVVLAFRQFDRAEAPLCSSDTIGSFSSPNDSVEGEIARVSCLGGGPRQRLILREGGSAHTVVSFEDAERIQLQWTSDNELEVRHRGGKLITFQPTWRQVRIRFR
ncbi:MAG TPA: hypothetical protein VG839_00235 [Asticcacaulis sp.]|nr:hypothetical protein [Asticcacaulis sp.]